MFSDIISVALVQVLLFVINVKASFVHYMYFISVAFDIKALHC